jgi:hypothetical protein
MKTTKRTPCVEVLEDRQLCAGIGAALAPMPRFLAPTDRFGNVKNLDHAPGGNDSIWLDLSYPVQYRETDFNFVAGRIDKFEIYDYPGEYSQRFDSSYRVRVRFPWLAGPNEDNTYWARVSQPWAGKHWGSSFWPRIGQEGAVHFAEGDPDRPILTGTVPNSR